MMPFQWQQAASLRRFELFKQVGETVSIDLLHDCCCCCCCYCCLVSLICLVMPKGPITAATRCVTSLRALAFLKRGRQTIKAAFSLVSFIRERA